jgi:hypothetical protein
VDFYLMAAQVIPVLYLALAFETKDLNRRPASYDPDSDSPRRWNATQIVGRIYLVSLMAIGELAALVGAYVGRRMSLLNGLTWAALVAGLYMVSATPIAQQRKYFSEWWAAGAPDKGLLALVLVAVITMTGYFVSLFW